MSAREFCSYCKITDGHCHFLCLLSFVVSTYFIIMLLVVADTLLHDFLEIEKLCDFKRLWNFQDND